MSNQVLLQMSWTEWTYLFIEFTLALLSKYAVSIFLSRFFVFVVISKRENFWIFQKKKKEETVHTCVCIYTKYE